MVGHLNSNFRKPQKLVIFNPSMGFNVTAPGKKVTVYEGIVGLDVTRNKATWVKSHIIDIIFLEYTPVYVFTSYCFSVIFMLPMLPSTMMCRLKFQNTIGFAYKSLCMRMMPINIVYM